MAANSVVGGDSIQCGGGKRLTSIEAVARFVERQNTPPANGQDEVAALEDAKQDDDYLKKHGLGRDDD